MFSGRKRRSSPAATIAQRYPETRACEESASIDWAREMRGTSSIAKEVTPRSRRSVTRSWEELTGRNETVAAPSRSSRRR